MRSGRPSKMSESTSRRRRSWWSTLGEPEEDVRARAPRVGCATLGYPKSQPEGEARRELPRAGAAAGVEEPAPVGRRSLVALSASLASRGGRALLCARGAGSGFSECRPAASPEGPVADRLEELRHVMASALCGQRANDGRASSLSTSELHMAVACNSAKRAAASWAKGTRTHCRIKG